MKEALFYTPIIENIVQCDLCPHHCTIKPNKTGICRVRKNINGTLFSLVYGHPVAQSIDPIEKKPLYHFYPGSLTYSIATIGCNLHCKHCQNADISQTSIDTSSLTQVSVESIIDTSLKNRITSIAYTYTEPTIFYEYAFDIAQHAHEHNLKNVFVTNGYITKEAIEKISPIIDGANIDLKAMTDEFYKKICGARLQPVLDAIQLYIELGVWVEITTLIIPGYNDNDQELKKLASFIHEINPEIPWHVTGFTPTYHLQDTPATTVSMLEKAVSIGKEVGLKYIYMGNRGFGEDTICPICRKQLILRNGFYLSNNKIINNHCPECHTKIPGVSLDGKNPK
jgi:pyruvate formate lyase activating enzyme